MQTHNKQKDYLDSNNNEDTEKRLKALGLPQSDINILEEIKYGTPILRGRTVK